tara:strand:- start:4001 stop:5551 length:1551 start_codon:yes stop_codon:yes gene_type:complete
MLRHLLIPLLTSATIAQPTLGPDEPASAFIERWNAWCQETDPDQQLLADLQATNDAIWEAQRAVAERYGVYSSLDDIAAPGNWPAAQATAEAIAPHTARLRELLARPHLAFPFPGPEVEAARRAERDADFKENPPEDDSIVWDRGPMPANQREMYLTDTGLTFEVRSAVSQLRLETNYAIHTGNLGLAIDNTVAYLEAARLQLERHTLMSAFDVDSTERTAVSSIESILVRHSRRLRDGALERVQTVMLDHAARRRGHAGSLTLEHRVFAEVLPTWFDPDQPDRLTDRGREFLDAMSIAGAEPNWLDPDFHFSLRTRPSFEGSLAPASEQIRVFNAINAAYARDTATPWHAREDLESAQLFKAMVEADPQGRLAPALDRFAFYDYFIWIDLRNETNFRAALTILGVHRHRARTGQWPQALAAIDPEIMRFDPIDPHSGQPFGYAVIDDQPTLWSAGPDRDNDDGRPIPKPPAPPEGEFPEAPSRRWFTLNEWNALPPEVQAEYDGDIPLFPPPADR